MILDLPSWKYDFIDVRVGKAAERSNVGAHSQASAAPCCRGERLLIGEHQ
jgi:hypothetical protein